MTNNLRVERAILRMTQQQLAEAVGVSRVTVSRVLSQWSRQGLVATGYGTLTLLDHDRLLALAYPEE